MEAHRRRAFILETCKPIFARKGFENTTTREIAKAAGITEPILYRHFKNKEEIYRELEAFCVGNAQNISALLDRIPQGTRRLVYLVHALIATLIDARPMADSPKYKRDAEITYRLLLKSLLTDGAFARQNNRASVKCLIPFFFEALSAARGEGDLTGAPMDTEDFWILFEMVQGPGFYNLPPKRASGRQSKGQALVRRMTLLILQSMGLSKSALQKYYPENASKLILEALMESNQDQTLLT